MRPILTGPWEIQAEKQDWRGVRLYRVRHGETGEEFLLEDLALATPVKERIHREIAAGLEEQIARAEVVHHPALRRPIGLTRHESLYLLVRPWEALLWDGWGEEPRPDGPVELGEWLRTMAEVLAAYHEAGLFTGGLARVDLVRSGQGLLVLEPICHRHLAAYRDRELFQRHELVPEISRGRPWSQAADLFAFGLNGYQLATGRLPFAGSGPVLADNLLSAAVVDPRSYAPLLGPGLTRTILALLDRDPARRPAAAKVAASLADLAETGRFTATAREQEEFARGGQRLAGLVERGERVRGYLRRNRVIIAAAVAGVVLAVLLFTFRGRPPTPTITSATGPSQVVTAYYRAIDGLDQVLLEETLAPGVGKATMNMVVTLFVINRVTLAETGQSMTGPALLRVKDLAVKRLHATPQRFVASYDLVLRKGSGETMVFNHRYSEDTLTLERRKSRRVGSKWVIARISQKILAEKETPATPEEISASQPKTALPM